MLLSTLLFGGLALALPSVNVQTHAKRHDDVIAFGKNGRVEVFQRDFYNELTRNISRGPPPNSYPHLTHDVNGIKGVNQLLTEREAIKKRDSLKPSATVPTKAGPQERDVEKRACTSHKLAVDHTSKFLQWDVPMSRVIHAAAAQSTVILTDGFQLANALSIAQSAAFDFVPDFFTSTTKVEWTRTWTTTTTLAYSFPVPKGQWGIVVSNPQTERHFGEVWEGCIGQMRLVSTYSGDSYTDHSYGGLSWVEGTITACTARKYPIPKCVGTGVNE
ncbi:celp0028 effector like protein [Venturia nashicola]|uniref:Effector like protein n=1 Tax=Venturia nashicola TaxID=86259 RepID=A0A4Z1PG80_9PEZI|nr:effector like protein [Venturia nashicola]TLD36835.1 celp0028 effector like protein [Venturia nashicola]